jgi:hypothetical protein
MTQLLTRAEALVTSVPDVGRALTLLEDFTPQMLVSDLAMPEQDGFDLVTYLRRNGYGPERLPAIAFSAFAGVKTDNAHWPPVFRPSLSNRSIRPSSLRRSPPWPSASRLLTASRMVSPTCVL